MPLRVRDSSPLALQVTALVSFRHLMPEKDWLQATREQYRQDGGKEEAKEEAKLAAMALMRYQTIGVVCCTVGWLKILIGQAFLSMSGTMSPVSERTQCADGG